EGMTESEVLAVDAQADVANCALTTYVREGSRLRLEAFNDVTHLREQSEPVTAEPDTARAPR
ncbi:MAG: hypothetical protein ACXVFV_06030, partial [Mycobacteriales bacterium]